jgi:hypothetical protein
MHRTGWGFALPFIDREIDNHFWLFCNKARVDLE